MIGVSLPVKWLLDGKGDPGDRVGVLAALRMQGVASIELRTVKPGQNPRDVADVAHLLWGQGFRITVHGKANSVETAVSDVFEPLTGLLSEMGQEDLVVTIHPVEGDNVKMLSDLSDHCIANHYPVTIALENNRLLPGKLEGDCAALVLEAVETVNRENVGICFDFGHYAYYRKKLCPDTPDAPPPEAFLKRVVHTHIHGLNGLKTHFPLGQFPLPLKSWLEALAFEYFGVYNIELDFPRFAGLCSPMPALLNSVMQLQSDMPLCARVYDEVRKHFDDWFSEAASVLSEQEKGTWFGLIHSTSYLFNTDGFCWGMDIAFRNARILAKSPARAAEILKPLKLMLITHGHRDHFEESTLRLLSGLDLQWIIPDFLVEKALSYGLDPKKIITARPGEWIEVGPLRVLPFPGRHVRPDSGRGPKEYGYHVATKHCSMVFPGDIRDFAPEGVPELPRADYCFAHVWLGDKMALEESYGRILVDWSAYILSFCRKRLLLTHLNEDGRPDDSMWRPRHARMLAEKIAELSHRTEVRIPTRGEKMKL